MSIPDFIDTLVSFGGFLANALVCALAVNAYRDTRKRCLLLIAVSAGIGAALAVVPWIRQPSPSWAFWGFHTVATICDLGLWVVGAWLLFRDYAGLVMRFAQPPKDWKGPECED